MRITIFLIFTLSVLFLNTSYAKSNNTHSHNGRSHDHPLPRQGVKHRHGGGALGKTHKNSSIQINNKVSGSLPWLGSDLVESKRWKAKINIKCLKKGKSCGTIDFQSLNCGGNLTFVSRNSDNFIFSDQIKYGNCTQNCQIHIKSDGSSYKEFCKNRYTGGGKLRLTNTAKRQKQITTTSKSSINVHSHEGRPHTHTLPKQGVKHRHGKGALGVTGSRSTVTSNSSPTPSLSTSSKNISGNTCPPFSLALLNKAKKKFSGKQNTTGINYNEWKELKGVFKNISLARSNYLTSRFKGHMKSGGGHYFDPNGDYFKRDKDGIIRKGKWNTADGRLCTWIDGKLNTSIPFGRTGNLLRVLKENGEIGSGNNGFQGQFYTFTPNVNNPKYVNNDKKNYFKQSQWRNKFDTSNSSENWTSINYKEMFKLISGNTLISKNNHFCKNKSDSSKACQKIVVLSKVDKFSIARHPSTTIYPEQKKTVKSEWGYYAINALYLGLDFGILKIPTNSSFVSFNNVVKVNQNKNKIQVTSKKTKQIFIIDIIKGSNSRMLAKYNNKNHIQLNERGAKTVGQALVDKGAEKAVKVIKEAARSMANAPKSQHYCFASGLTEGMKNMCLAIVNKRESYCYGTGLNESMKNVCLANVKKESSYCFGTNINEGNKNTCLASVKNESSYCYGTGVTEVMKNVCLASVKHEPSYCYSSGISEGMKNMCLAISKAK